MGPCSASQNALAAVVQLVVVRLIGKPRSVVVPVQIQHPASWASSPSSGVASRHGIGRVFLLMRRELWIQAVYATLVAMTPMDHPSDSSAQQDAEFLIRDAVARKVGVSLSKQRLQL